jgi:hypothetical protein
MEGDLCWVRCRLQVVAWIALLLAACAGDDRQPADGSPPDPTTAGTGAGGGGSAALAGSGGVRVNPRPRAGSGSGNDPDGDPSATRAGSGGNGAAGSSGVGTGMPEQAGTGGCGAEESAAACAGIECGVAPMCERFCGSCPANAQCKGGRCEPNDCAPLDLAIEVYGACALDLASGVDLDGEAFIDADGRQQRVLALNRWGTGHFIAWCDSSTLVDLVTGVNARRYLGRSDSARVASFGDDFMCNPGSVSAYPLPPWVTYLGQSLPIQYRDAPEALAADWDAVIFCGYRIEWDEAWIPTLQAYVNEHGRGLLASLDYAGVDARPSDFAHMNAVIAPTGVTFLEVLNFQATAMVSVDEQECVPDLPGPD